MRFWCLLEMKEDNVNGHPRQRAYGRTCSEQGSQVLSAADVPNDLNDRTDLLRTSTSKERRGQLLHEKATRSGMGGIVFLNLGRRHAHLKQAHIPVEEAS